MMKAPFISWIVFIALAGAAQATNWYILPDGTGDAPTIQAAVNLAAPGDTVLLADGVFTGIGNREVSFLGKAIVITSENGADYTTIDCENAGPGFIFLNNEGPSSILLNLTIVNAALGASGFGGGVAVLTGSPTISGNHIRDCTSTTGGGIYSPNLGAPLIEYNVIESCSASTGGGIFCGGSTTLLGNTVSGNTALNGGGITILAGGNPNIVGNHVIGNYASALGGGIFCGPNSTSSLDNNTIANNTAVGLTEPGAGGGVFCDNGSVTTIVNNLIEDNQWTSYGSIGGGGICAHQATVTISDNLLQNNVSPTGEIGGAIHLRDTFGLVERNEFFDNQGAIAISGTALVTGDTTAIRECVFSGNTGDWCVVWARDTRERVAIENCTIAENLGPRLYLAPTADITKCIIAFNACRAYGCGDVSCSNVFGNALGDSICGDTDNFSADPRFCGIPGSRIYGLTTVSPCAPANSPCGELVGALPVSCGPVAVAFADVSAATTPFSVDLSWRVASDTEIREFVVYRRSPGASTYAIVAAMLSPGARSYVDRSVAPNTRYEYVIAAVDVNGDEFQSPVQRTTTNSIHFALEQNYPNPFNPVTSIAFTLPEPRVVSLVIYDALGRPVRELASGQQPVGRHVIDWDGRDTRGDRVASGVYFCRLRAGSQVLMRKMVLLK